MRIEKAVDSWKEFPTVLNEVKNKYGVVPGSDPPRRTNMLFRGQSDSSWALSTTLDRRSSSKFDAFGYERRIRLCSDQIESVTGRTFDLKELRKVEAEIATIVRDRRVCIPSYSYWAYLRQFGFPSPLLDWSESPYVAAYFAFADKKESEQVAIFAYIDKPSGGKPGQGVNQFIYEVGPYVTTHPRHFAQKTWYTMAVRIAEPTYVFCSHEDVLSSDDTMQQLVVKITIPSSEREQVLKELQEFNIDHFTLFQTEDALVRALAMREFGA